MAEENRPASPQQAPNPAHTYERAEPNREADASGLGTNESTPTNRPDDKHKTVPNRTHPQRQINADEPDHSMHQDQPTDADSSPQAIEDPRRKRYPRIGGKRGTPDVGENRRES